MGVVVLAAIGCLLLRSSSAPGAIPATIVYLAYTRVAILINVPTSRGLRISKLTYFSIIMSSMLLSSLIILAPCILFVLIFTPAMGLERLVVALGAALFATYFMRRLVWEPSLRAGKVPRLDLGNSGKKKLE